MTVRVGLIGMYMLVLEKQANEVIKKINIWNLKL